MKIKAVPLSSIGMVLLLSGTLWCQDPNTYNDVIFVKQQRNGGVYREISGHIIQLNSREIVIVTEGKRSLYTRDVVKRVELDIDRKDDYKEKIDLYWNRDKSQIVDAVQKTPVIGPYLSFLDELPGSSDIFLSVLILLFVLSYAVYKLYHAFVISVDLRKLNRTKLNMEISKLRFEIDDMKKQMGISPEAVHDRIQIPKTVKEAIFHDFKLPEIHLLDFIKYKIFRIMTDQQKQQRTEFWMKKWQSHKDRPLWLLLLYYYTRLSLNVTAAIFVGFFGLGSVIDIFLPVIEPDLMGGTSPFISLIFVIMSVLMIALFVRLNVQRRIMRKTYREVCT